MFLSAFFLYQRVNFCINVDIIDVIIVFLYFLVVLLLLLLYFCCFFILLLLFCQFCYSYFYCFFCFLCFNHNYGCRYCIFDKNVVFVVVENYNKNVSMRKTKLTLIMQKMMIKTTLHLLRLSKVGRQQEKDVKKIIYYIGNKNKNMKMKNENIF